MSEKVFRDPISRRALLRGVGASVALPWLESINAWGASASAVSAASEAPRRFAALFMSNGVLPEAWHAEGAGDQTQAWLFGSQHQAGERSLVADSLCHDLIHGRRDADLRHPERLGAGQDIRALAFVWTAGLVGNFVEKTADCQQVLLVPLQGAPGAGGPRRTDKSLWARPELVSSMRWLHHRGPNKGRSDPSVAVRFPAPGWGAESCGRFSLP